jgi:hypothetical protein
VPKSSRADINGSELEFFPNDVIGQVAHHAQQTVRALTEVEVLVVAQKDLPSLAEKLNQDMSTGAEFAVQPQAVSKPHRPPPRQVMAKP